MITIRVAALICVAFMSSLVLPGQGSAQGLPLTDSPGTSGVGSHSTHSHTNTRWGWNNAGVTRFQPQPILVWSTTAYLNQADAIVLNLRGQGYTVTWQNRVIPYGYYRTVYVTDIYAWVYR